MIGLAGQDVTPELVGVEELERARGVDLRVPPLEPDVHVDVVGVRLQVELLDVVDQGPDPDDVGAVAGGLGLLAPGRGRDQHGGGDEGSDRYGQLPEHDFGNLAAQHAGRGSARRIRRGL